MDLAITCSEMVFKGAHCSTEACQSILSPWHEASQRNWHSEMLYNEWCLVADLTNINERVYFLFGEDLNLLYLCLNSRWYKQVLVWRACAWSAGVSSDVCMAVLALEFVNSLLWWSASKASMDLGTRLKDLQCII